MHSRLFTYTSQPMQYLVISVLLAKSSMTVEASNKGKNYMYPSKTSLTTATTIFY